MINLELSKKNILRQEFERNIETGVFRSGMQLPTERMLCATYNVSRPVIRTVVQELIADGILTREPGRRMTFIAPTAMTILSHQRARANMTVQVVIPAIWMNNYLIIKMFSTLQERLSSKVHFVLHWGNCWSFLNEPAQPADVLLVFHDDQHVTAIPPEMALQLKSKFKDVIFINERLEGFNHIGPDHETGGRLMARYLLSKNHRHVANILFDSAHSSDFALRHKGFVAEFSKYGTVQNLPLLPDNRDSSVQMFRFLLRQNPRITAIACVSDYHAVMLYERLAGICSIPDDFSIMGFDDQYFSQYMTPPLTTMKYPSEIIAARLAEHISELLQGQENRIDEKIVPPLIERGSVKELELA